MKKIISTVLTTGLLLANLTACSSTDDTSTGTATGSTPSTTDSTTPSSTGSSDAIKIVATTFPEYDWLRQIVGEDNDAVELSLLLQSGVDLHSYQPTVDDIVTISQADLFVHVGGVSDSWVDGAIAEATNENIVVLNEISILGSAVKMEESVEGMQAGSHDDHDHSDEEEHDHDEEEHDHSDEEEHDHSDEEEHDHSDEEEHDHDHEEEHDHSDEEEHDHSDEEEHDHSDEEEHDHDEEEHDHDEEEHDHSDEEHDHSDEEEHSGHNHEDEHVWLSLRNAQEICEVLTQNLCEIMPDQAEVFEANLESYLQELSDLDDAYTEMVADASSKTILVADRFPFRYLVDDYNIEYYAAFTGCSAETEASFETIAFLSEKVDELGMGTILTIENPSHNIATTVVSTASQDPDIQELDSMQSTTLSEANSGTTYLSVMKANLEVLREALK